MSEASKERPINARTWEVRAMLAGSKTQFRRRVKAPRWFEGHTITSAEYERIEGSSRVGRKYGYHQIICERDGGRQKRCPWGVPGERIWVRERWAENYAFVSGGSPHYRADLPDDCNAALTADHSFGLMKWQSAMHMPRAYSRITLEIEDVRVERLKEIADYDAFHEGLEEWLRSTTRESAHDSARHAYSRLWESLYGPDSWKKNPWVWAITFMVQQ